MGETNEKIMQEFDDQGNLVRKTIILDPFQQSSVELNFDKKEGVAVKVKVYNDTAPGLDTQLTEFIKVAERHAGRKLM